MQKKFVKSDTLNVIKVILLLTDVSKNLIKKKKKRLKIYYVDPVKFLSAPGLT